MTAVTIAYGDGIGPEIMEATVKVLEASGADLEFKPINIGLKVYEQGIAGGIEPGAWDTLRETKVFLKAPITTPQGGGVKSLNVTVRKTLGLYANVRPCVAYNPYVRTLHPGMDVVIVRENEEGLYGGIEHQQSYEVVQTLKLFSAQGVERICRYGFEYARCYGRRKVTCFSKDNIMKHTDGMFHKIFNQVASEYPDIESDHMIIDIGTARLAARPETFDVIVTSNLYGDIISDVAAEIAGSVGLVGTANIGQQCAMFEAIHGSAPDIAGKDIANPSGLLLAAVQMLVHVGQADIATTIHNAWLATIEDGIHTGDVYNAETSKEKVGTQAFADAVVARLGQQPKHLKAVAYKTMPQTEALNKLPITEQYYAKKRELVGVDVFLCQDNCDVEKMAHDLRNLQGDHFVLQLITNRGTKVWPDGLPETLCTDHWRCRFAQQGNITNHDIVELLARINAAELDVIKTENLYTFDGELGYSKGQGQ